MRLFFCYFLIFVLQKFSYGLPSDAAVCPCPNALDQIIFVDKPSVCEYRAGQLVPYSSKIDWVYLTLFAIPASTQDSQLLAVNVLMAGLLALVMSQHLLEADHATWLYGNLVDSWDEYWFNQDNTTDPFGFPEKIVANITEVQKEYWMNRQFTASVNLKEEVDNAIALVVYILTGDKDRASFIAEGGLYAGVPENNILELPQRSHNSVKVSQYHEEINDIFLDFCEDNVCDTSDWMIVSNEQENGRLNRVLNLLSHPALINVSKLMESLMSLTVELCGIGKAHSIDSVTMLIDTINHPKVLKAVKFFTKCQKELAINRASTRKRAKNLAPIPLKSSKEEQDFLNELNQSFWPNLQTKDTLGSTLLSLSFWTNIERKVALTVALYSFVQVLEAYYLGSNSIKMPFMDSLKTFTYRVNVPLGLAAFAQKTQHLHELEKMSLQIQSYDLPDDIISADFHHIALAHIKQNLEHYYEAQNLDQQTMNARLKLLRTMIAGTLCLVGDYLFVYMGVDKHPVAVLLKSIALMGIFAINLNKSATALIENLQNDNDQSLEQLIEKRQEVATLKNSDLSNDTLRRIANDYKASGFEGLDDEAKIYLASIQGVHDLVAIDASFATVLLLESLWAGDVETVRFLEHMKISSEKIDLLKESQKYPGAHEQAHKILQSYLWKK